MNFLNLTLVICSFLLSFQVVAKEGTPSKVDIISKGEKVGFRVQNDCSLSEKYLYQSCTYIPEQTIYCTSLGEKVITEKVDCSGNKVTIALVTEDSVSKKRQTEGQGNSQTKINFWDRFRMQQQQQQQESRR